MSLLEYFILGTQNWLSVIITSFIVVVTIASVNYVLKKRWQKKSDMHFHFQLSMLALGFLGGLIIIISLPISETLRGQLLSLIGILLSAAIALSSTTFIGNILAGIMLKVVGNLRVGKFVIFQDISGRVSEIGLLHVEIQTEDRDLVTLPNMLMATQAVKYTRSSGTIVSADVSLGYDVARTEVVERLNQASSHAGLEDGFVQVRELGDFAITYRVAGLLKDINSLLSARSKLRESILDTLHNAGIEIVSPNFMNTRALNTKDSVIPSPHAIDNNTEAPNSPEDLIFDKADAAASIQEIQDMIKTLESEINAEDEDKRALSDSELNALHAKKERLLASLQHAEEQQKIAEAHD